MKGKKVSLKIPKHFGIFILGFIFINCTWLWSMLYLNYFENSITASIFLLFNIISLILAVILIAIFFRINDRKLLFLKIFFLGLIGFATIYLSNVIMSYTMKLWSMLRVPLLAIGYSGEVIFGVIYFLIMFIQIMVILFVFNLTLSSMKYGEWLFSPVLKNLTSNKIRFFLFSLIMTILFGVLLWLLPFAEKFVNEILITGFQKRFLLTIITATLEAYVGLIILKCMTDFDSYNLYNSKKRFPFIYGFLVLGAITFIIVILSPKFSNPLTPYLSEIKYYISSGDSYYENNENIRGEASYFRAMNNLYALKDFLMEKDNSTLPDIFKIFTPYEDFFRESMEYKKTGTSNFDNLKNVRNEISFADLYILKYSQIDNLKQLKYDTLQRILKNNTWIDPFLKLKEKDKETALNEINEIEKLLMERVHMSLYNTELSHDFSDEIFAISEMEIEYPMKNYYSALIANKNGDKITAYEAAREYYEETKTIDSALFASYLYVAAGEIDTAREFMTNIYKDNETEISVAEDYAYVLMAKEYDKYERNNPYDLAKEILYKNQNKLTNLGIYLKSLNHMIYGEYKESIDTINLITKKMNKTDDDLEFLALEEYLYDFILVYLDLNENGEDLTLFYKEIEKLPETNYLKFYILGLRGTNEENYKSSNDYFNRAIKVEPRLTYVYGLIGINYNEMNLARLGDYTSIAEKNLIKYTFLRPDRPESFFILGFHYKHRGENELAKRAFYRVLSVYSYQDYEKDAYGTSVHSLMEIENMGGMEQ